jgi:hypothetical protein
MLLITKPFDMEFFFFVYTFCSRSLFLGNLIYSDEAEVQFVSPQQAGLRSASYGSKDKAVPFIFLWDVPGISYTPLDTDSAASVFGCQAFIPNVLYISYDSF